jgi:hypothetical protein
MRSRFSDRLTEHRNQPAHFHSGRAKCTLGELEPTSQDSQRLDEIVDCGSDDFVPQLLELARLRFKR